MDSRAKLLGHPIHQMLIVFPLGLLITAVIFDIVYFATDAPGFATVAYWNILGGIIGGLLAGIFGFIDWLAIPQGTRAKRIGMMHGIGNVVVLVLFIVAWALRSDDPVERFAEMLRLLNESYLIIDPLYGMVRRAPVAAIPRRNMLREDEVFAAKLALAGPWGHVPEVLAHRHWKLERIGVVARRLGVPSWQSRCANTLQFRELLAWIRTADLTEAQRQRARVAIYRMYARRQRRTLGRRGRKLLRLAGVIR